MCSESVVTILDGRDSSLGILEIETSHLQNNVSTEFVSTRL